MTPNEILTTELETVQELRRRGFAVAIWAPDEIGKVRPRLLEQFVVESASEFIDDANCPED